MKQSSMRTGSAFLVMALMMTTAAAPVQAAWWNPVDWWRAVAGTSKPKQETKETKPMQTSTSTSSAAIAASQYVRLQTQQGNILIELLPDAAPVTVDNFLTLVQSNFYNVPKLNFHRVVPGFVVQTGDPTGTGFGGSKKKIPLEVKNKLTHNAPGIVAMARGPEPDSASSQFYITLAPQAHLDGKYAVFGKVVSGLDVLPRIEQGDRVYAVDLVDKSSVDASQLDSNKAREKSSATSSSSKEGDEGGNWMTRPFKKLF